MLIYLPFIEHLLYEALSWGWQTRKPDDMGGFNCIFFYTIYIKKASIYLALLEFVLSTLCPLYEWKLNGICVNGN